jgi:cobalamin biosynthesis protein CobT
MRTASTSSTRSSPFSGFEFESDLARIARALTRRYDVRIVFGPGAARVEGNTVVLPAQQEGRIERDVLIGYLDLLAARAKFSPDAHKIFSGARSRFVQRLAQIVEDRRVARRLQRDYPGAQVFFARLRRHALHQAGRRWRSWSWSARLLWLIENVLWSDCENKVQGGTDASREEAGLDDADGSLQASLYALADGLVRARASQSARSSLAAAQAIAVRLNLLASGRVNTMMQSADPAGLPQQDDGDVDSAERVDEDTLDANEAAAHQDATDSGPTPMQGEAADIAEAGMGATMPKAERDDGAPPAPTPAISAGAAAHLPTLSVPLSTQFDVVTDLSGLGESSAWRALRSEARAETAALRNRLERALKADEWTHWRREQERGTIDRAALARVATQPGYRTPFAQKRVNQGRDSAVTILIDASGSMAGAKIRLARLCAAALADALQQLDFACEVLGYSSVESPELRALRDAQRAAGADMRRYNRSTERLDLYVYKRFDATDLSGIAQIACGHENPDGECLSWAAARLAERSAGRRILLVLSDGYPATGDGHPAILRADLQRRVAAIAQSGIELIGVGVLDDAVETFYPESVVVHTLSELPTVAFEVLSRRLLTGRSPGRLS